MAPASSFLGCHVYDTLGESPFPSSKVVKGIRVSFSDHHKEEPFSEKIHIEEGAWLLVLQIVLVPTKDRYTGAQGNRWNRDSRPPPTKPCRHVAGRGANARCVFFFC